MCIRDSRYVVDIHFKQLRCTFTITLYWPAKQFIPKAGERQLPLQKADRRELWCWERSDWLTAGSVASTRPCVNVCNQPCPFRDHTRGEAETVAANRRKIAYAKPLHLHFWSSFFFHFSKSDFEFDDLHRLCWTGFLLSGRSFCLVTGETATTRAERLFQLLGETYQHGRIVEEETSRRQSHRADYSLCRCRSSCLLEV